MTDDARGDDEVVPQHGSIEPEDDAGAPAKSEDAAKDQERFRLLTSSLEKYQDRFVSGTLAALTITLLIIGWLLTSTTAQDFFRAHVVFTRVSSILAVVVGAASWVVAMSRLYSTSQRLSAMAQAIGYLEEDYYRHYVIPKLLFVLSIGNVLGLYGVIIYLLLNVP